MIHVIIADDHMLVRQGLRRLLEDVTDITVVGEAGSGQETLGLIAKIPACSLLLLDISLPDRSGLEVLKDVHALRPNLPVLILSVYPEEQYAIRAFRAGAAGYLRKAAAAHELLDAVRRTGQGGKYITPSVAEKMADNFRSRRSTQLPHELLSDREFEVLARISEGLSVSDISKTLGLSPKTISTYRSRILQKMGLKNSAELMHYAFENQLVS
jgi:two-component system invasion response regulator UvrY